VVNFALAVVCAAIGLVALPIAFGSSSASSAASWTISVWFLAAAAVSIALLALLPRLSQALAKGVDRYARSATPSQTRLASQLAVLAIVLVIVQASLRRPLAFLIGGISGSAAYEAAIAATALTLVLALLVWLYQTGRPLLQTAMLRAIDSAFPTVQPALVSEPTRTVSVIAADATVRAPSREAATQRVESESEATLRAQPDPEATVLRGADADVTVITTAPQVDSDATLRAPRANGA
jgi:hypothetical protein